MAEEDVESSARNRSPSDRRSIPPPSPKPDRSQRVIDLAAVETGVHNHLTVSPGEGAEITDSSGGEKAEESHPQGGGEEQAMSLRVRGRDSSESGINEQAEGIAGRSTDRTLLRLGAGAGIAGLVLQIVMDRFHPGRADPNNSLAAFREYAASQSWVMVHIGQFVGTLLITVALVALANSMFKQPGAAGTMAKIGAVTAVIVAAIFAVQMAVDGVALKGSIDAWQDAASAADKAVTFQVAEGIRRIEKGLGGFFQLVNGVTLLTLGLSVALGSLYSRWLGWVAVVAGLGFVAGGTSTALTGFSMQATMILTAPSLLGLLFIVCVCISMWRKGASSAG